MKKMKQGNFENRISVFINSLFIHYSVKLQGKARTLVSKTGVKHLILKEN